MTCTDVHDHVLHTLNNNRAVNKTQVGIVDNSWCDLFCLLYYYVIGRHDMSMKKKKGHLVQSVIATVPQCNGHCVTHIRSLVCWFFVVCLCLLLFLQVYRSPDSLFFFKNAGSKTNKRQQKLYILLLLPPNWKEKRGKVCFWLFLPFTSPPPNCLVFLCCLLGVCVDCRCDHRYMPIA